MAGSLLLAVPRGVEGSRRAVVIPGGDLAGLAKDVGRIAFVRFASPVD